MMFNTSAQSQVSSASCTAGASNSRSILMFIVSGGGMRTENETMLWVDGKKNDWRFLFPVKAMNIVFRAKYLEGLKTLLANQSVQPPADTDITSVIKRLYQKDWIVYAKQPFGGPEQVIEYLGRYTHKVAISNHRIKAISHTDNTVTFDYKDYADKGKQKQMTLHNGEFVRRFEQHILPHRFTKIRSYGYLANRGRKQRLNQMLEVMQLPKHPPPVKVPWQVRLLEWFGIVADKCPQCNQAILRLIACQFPGQNAPNSI